MSTTLTNGLKLPDKGSVDWYADMQNNYTILDGAIGTIADHTTAIAGKAASLHTHTKSDVTDLLNSNFIPSANNSYDLGSSSYQWNNVYAKNYYYNGVAWGLDKQNEWTNFQRMTSNPAAWYLRNNTVTLGTAPSSNRYIGMFFEDVNGADLGYVSFQANKNSYNSIMFSLRNFDGTNAYTGALRYRASTTGDYSFFPETSECDLGTSTNKWKTLNGVNPGALSLPDYDETKAISVDTTGWTYDGSTANQLKINNATQTINGWLFIRIENVASTDRVIIRFNSNLASDPAMGFSPASTGINLIMPIPANKITNIYLTKSPMRIKFYPCLGNV